METVDMNRGTEVNIQKRRSIIHCCSSTLNCNQTIYVNLRGKVMKHTV